MHTHTQRDVCTERQAHTHTHTHWGNVKRKTMTDWRHVAAAAAAAAAATTASHYERIHRNRQRCREATTTREEQKKKSRESLHATERYPVQHLWRTYSSISTVIDNLC